MIIGCSTTETMDGSRVAELKELQLPSLNAPEVIVTRLRKSYFGIGVATKIWGQTN